MRWKSLVLTTINIAPSTRESQTKRPSAMMIYSELVWPTWGNLMPQQVFVACARMNSTSINGWNDCDEATLPSFFGVFSGECINTIAAECHFLCGRVSSPFVASLDNASAACGLIPAWCTTSKSNFDSRRRLEAR